MLNSGDLRAVAVLCLVDYSPRLAGCHRGDSSLLEAHRAAGQGAFVAIEEAVRHV
jgi:hypothetical protein